MKWFGKFACFAIFAIFAVAGVDAQSPHTSQGQAAGRQQEFNPQRAIHDVEVGKFYMKRGDLAGAIARFQDALLYKPHYAEACLLLGRVYEKQNDPHRAIVYYQRYLEILPNTSESRKVRQRISALREKMSQSQAAEHKIR